MDISLKADQTYVDTRINSVMTLFLDLPNQSYITEKVKKGSLFVNVKDFGAIGDGVTDDTAAIQVALDSVRVSASGRNGALVFFPAGTYLISNSIKTYANVMIMGVGRRGSTLLLKAGSTADAMIVRQGGTDGYWVQIKDICLDGQASQQSIAADGIRLEDTAEPLIENVGIRFVRGNSIKITRVSTTSIQPTIKNCIIRADKDNHALDSAGIFLDYGSYDAILSENDIGYYKNGYGIRLNQHNGATISNNNAWQCKNGYRLESANRIRLTANLSDYADEHGYYFTGSTELQLSNCQSRWSGCKTPTIYDGFHLYGCSDFILNSCMVLAGDGTNPLAGIGTGQTRFAISLTSTTKNGKYTGLIYKNCGEFFKDAEVTGISKASEVSV
jgi:hypothetical protein